MTTAANNDSIIKTTKIEINRHEIFLDHEIGDPSEYRDLISLLFNADEHDEFVFYINTPGGYLSTTRAIIEGMKHASGKVTGVLIGETYSSGSLIAMYCHELAVLDSAEMMIHTASFGSIGFTGNVKTHTDFTVNQVDKLINDAYRGFLSDEEINDVKKGVELWFGADDIRSRMEARIKILSEQEETKKD